MISHIAVPIHQKPRQPQSLTDWLFGGSATEEGATMGEITKEISGCEVQGQFYEKGAIVESSSGPCLQCRSVRSLI